MEATTVAAHGSAEAPYDHAGFTLTLSGLSSTPSSAKRLLADAISELNSVLTELRTNLNFDYVKNSLQTNSNVYPKHEWERQGENQVNVFKGYEVYYSLFFQIDNLDLVSKVYDALTSLDSVSGSVKVSVGQPTFTITPRTQERLNKKALKKAWDKVDERFETECDVLGLDPNAFEVATWEVSYSDSQRSDRVSNRLMHRAVGAPALAAAMGGTVPGVYSAQIASMEAVESSANDAPIIEIQVGLATVTVNLEVGFSRKADAKTIKAQVVSKGNRTTATSQSAGSPASTSSFTS